MNIIDRLNQLRTETPGCVLVALSDLSSGIILCSSSAIKQPQERLDSISSIANNMLDAKSGALTSQALGLTNVSDVNEAIAFNSSNAQIFLRSPQEKDDALCCICSIDVDTDAFVSRARAVLNEIAAIP